MKKTAIFSLALLALTACSGNKQQAQNADAAASDSTVYEGRIPAADCFGIDYRLALATDSTKGFALDETYMKDSLTADTAYHYQGMAADTTVNGSRFYVLKGGEDDTFRFKVVDDSTLRLVNNDFEEAASGLNYDLKLKK